MATTLHHRLLDQLGSQITSGELPLGTVLRADELSHERGVSRSVVREVTRVLQSLGMVTTIKRVGIRVQPASEWKLFDPLLIRWRLSVGSTGGQLRSLTELRSAVEPRAAELAALHRDDRTAARLLNLAVDMREVGNAGDLGRFLELDIDFHRLVLSASGNEMFAQLDLVIAEVLTARTVQGLMPRQPHPDALDLHVRTAEAIWARDAGAAHSAMDRIMRRTTAEVSQEWEHLPRPSITADPASG